MPTSSSIAPPLILLLAFSLPGQQESAEPIPTSPTREFSRHCMVNMGIERYRVAFESPVDPLRASTSFNFFAKKFYVHWAYEVPGVTSGPPDFPDYVTHVQEFALPYHPTEVACVGKGKLLVAGIGNMGVLTVEEFVFAPSPLAPLTFTNTGQEVIPYYKGEILSQRLVFRVQDTGSEYITAIYRNWITESQPFVLLADAGKVYQLNLEDLSYSLVASRSSGGLSVPELSLVRPIDGFDDFGSGLHSSLGAVYWMYSSATPELDVLVLRDADNNGSIESSFMITDWGASPLMDPSQYVNGRLR